MVAVNLGAAHYWLDHLYGAIMHRMRLAPPFFSGGWGGAKLELLEQMTRQLISQGLAQVSLQHWPPPTINPVWRTVWESRTARLQEGVFATPCDEMLKKVLPLESHIARVRLLSPRNVPVHKTSCVVHLADGQYRWLQSLVNFHDEAIDGMDVNKQSEGTGDHGFDRRLRLGGPLLEKNIATLVLESPYYGSRRPPLQSGARLLCVSDLLLLGRATIEETRTLLYWLEKEEGYKKLGVCGLSMGGVHAAMVGSLHRSPLAILPFLTPHSAAVAFCEGILQHGTAWEVLMRDELVTGSMTREQVVERLRTVLSLTDVTQFPVPQNPKSVIFVSATDDGYIPDHSVLKLQKAWPGSEVRWVRGGHVSSFILHNKTFQKAIVDGLDRLD